MCIRRLRVFTLAAGFLCSFLSFAAAQETSEPLDSLHWDLSKAKVTEIDGRVCATGAITLKNEKAIDFTAGFDMYLTGARSYPGILFRKTNEKEYERIYFRPHLPAFFQNVVQHVSTFNGIDSWQLYKGPGHTAALELPLKRWFHVKLSVKGHQATLYIENNTAPVMVVENLLHGDVPGSIELDATDDGAACFSNFVLQEYSTEPVPVQPKQDLPPGIVSKWELSPALKLADYDLEKYPLSQGVEIKNWKEAECREDGIVDVSRFCSFEGNIPNVVFARTNLYSDVAQNKLYSFGYSDIIAVFLNGELLFMGNSSYTSRDPNFQGIVGLNDYLNLSLRKGNNELMIALAETFGGWGFIFQDAKAVIQDSRMTKLWEVGAGWRFPETVIYDESRNCLYVSNFYNEGKEFISKVSTTGNIINKEWITGIIQPAGMCISNDKLYIACRFAIVEVDLKTGEISNRFPLKGAGMPNGITADEEGNLYVTDTRRDCVYKISNGNVTEWLTDNRLGRPNGILYLDKSLYIGGSGDGKLKKVDIGTKAIRTVASLEPGSEIDGIRPDGNGGILFSDYNGRLFHLNTKEATEMLLDSRIPQQFCASFEYVISKQMVVIPTLFDNRLIAYRLELSKK